jgi:trimethylamine corrinoid protein
MGADIINTPFNDLNSELELALKKAGLKGKYKTMVGGAPVTQRWADRIGADAYAEDAGEAVKKAKQLLN